MATDARRTGDEYAVWVNQLLALEGLAMADVTAVIISTGGAGGGGRGGNGGAGGAPGGGGGPGGGFGGPGGGNRPNNTGRPSPVPPTVHLGEGCGCITGTESRGGLLPSGGSGRSARRRGGLQVAKVSTASRPPASTRPSWHGPPAPARVP